MNHTQVGKALGAGGLVLAVVRLITFAAGKFIRAAWLHSMSISLKLNVQGAVIFR